MLEYPETKTIAGQLNQSVKGKEISSVVADTGSHRFAFFSEGVDYEEALLHKVVKEACAYGGLVQLEVGDNHLYFGDGANIRYYDNKQDISGKPLLLLGFSDGSYLAVSIQMYGRISLYRPDTELTFYDEVAIVKPAVDDKGFSEAYFQQLLNESDPKLSAKAFLATEQRIPGLGNGTLQDILWTVGVHPKTKLLQLDDKKQKALYQAVKDVISAMVKAGGRDTEKDLYGNYGGYQTILSKNTVGKPCPRCQSIIERKAYLGGNIYYCPDCQRER